MNTYAPPYGDVTELNTSRLIMDSVGQDTLNQIAEDAIDLLETSVAIYEANGDYAFGMFSSGWCRYMDATARDLCGTDDNLEALNCGKWLCHENCWNDSAKVAIETGRSTDIECVGGIHLYAEPIFSLERVVGVINIGYGDPPTDPEKLNQLAETFGVDAKILKEVAGSYEPRQKFLVNLAKKRLKSWARLIGEIVEKTQIQNERQESKSLEIAKLKQAEQALEARESFLSNVIVQSPFATWISDAEGTLQIANPALKKFLNLTDEQLVGKYNVLQDPVVERQGLMPLIRTVFEEGESISFTCDWDGNDISSLDLKGSKSVSIDATMFPIFSPEGELTNVVLNWIDITERQVAQNALLENEARFRSLFENMYDGVAIYRSENDGENFLFVDLNASGEALSKVEKNRIVGKRITEVFPGVTEMGLFDVMKRVYRTGKTEKRPITLYKDDRILEWVDNTVFRLPSNEIVAVYRDESERHMAEEEIRRLNKVLEQRVIERTKQLEATNEELEDFVYSVSHDLRAPLRSISGFAEIIDRRYKASLNEEGRHYFDNIIKASRQMGNLIDDLLEFSRLGRKSIKQEAVSLADVFEAVIETLGDEIEKTNTRIGIPKDLPVVQGDSALLVNIVINLLDNAIKYHKPDETPVINVAYEILDRFVVLSISDNGIGIEPEYQEKIFKMFQRLHSQTDYPGTGIGLAATKKALQMMDGEIRVESAPGKGSAFKINLLKPMTA
ncbi:MAG: PAS domain-containing protein [Deltaproteobacteria bacterium]|nr:PAS domain-containing protein [Deltaproteobacteria bacterium]